MKKKGLKLLTLALVALMTLTLSSPALAAGSMGNMNMNSMITIVLDGQTLTTEVPPVIENGRTLVPLRAIFEALGATVDYEDKTEKITAIKGTTKIELTVGKAQAKVNGQAKTLAVPAKVVKGRTLVPLRFVSEALGAVVNWEGTTTTVTISSVNHGKIEIHDNGAGNTGADAKTYAALKAIAIDAATSKVKQHVTHVEIGVSKWSGSQATLVATVGANTSKGQADLHFEIEFTNDGHSWHFSKLIDHN